MKDWWVPGAVIFGIAFLVAVTPLWYGYERLNPYWQGIAVESGGIVLEILLLTMLLGFYEHRRRQQDHINNLNRRISDFKGLDNEYAHAVIASSLRELADRGITHIDFRGSRLTKFRFYGEGIESLKDSVFADGLWLDRLRNNFGYMRHIDFSRMDCRCVTFSKGTLSLATYENCDFWSSDLRKASFKGATLKWDAESVIADRAQWSIREETDEGEPYSTPVYMSAFWEADLGQTNFDKCSFAYADFRGARNILSASFLEAEGLDTCFFDEGIRAKLKVR